MVLIHPRMRCVGTLALILGSPILVASACSPAPQQQTDQTSQTATTMAPSVPMAVSVNALMVSSTDHAGHAIWDAAAEAPKTDDAWLELEYHAIQLAALGTLVSLGGTGPADAGWARLPDWKRYSQEMSDAGVAAIDAARKKNVEAVKTVGDKLVATCEGCHKQFKPDTTTEGLLHKPHYPR